MNKKIKKGCGCLLGAVLLLAIAGAITLYVLRPKWHDEYGERYKDIAYGSLKNNTYDLYLPHDAASKDSLALMLYVHGGSWIAGNKWDHNKECYKWVQEALGEFWGFQAGWWRTISIYIDNTSYVILAGGYAATVWNMGIGGEFALKFCMIAIFTLINIRGVKDVGAVSTILSILVMVAFGVVALCGFLNWGSDPSVTFQMTPEPAPSTGCICPK